MTKKYIHVGHGNHIVVEKQNGQWVASLTKSNEKDTVLIKDDSRAKVENKCREFMKKHPYGVK